MQRYGLWTRPEVRFSVPEGVTRFGIQEMNADSRVVQFDEKPISASAHTISYSTIVILGDCCRAEREIGRGGKIRFCKGCPDPIQRREAYLRIRNEGVLEQHSVCRGILPDEHGLPALTVKWKIPLFSKSIDRRELREQKLRDSG